MATETAEQVEQVSPRTAAPTDPTRTPLADLSTQIVAAESKRRQAAERQRTGLETRAATVAPKLEAAQTALTAPLPTPPAPVTMPPPPSRTLRDYLASVDGEAPEHTVMQFISGLGVLAAGAAGMVKGDARGGLAALTGALAGWQAGDRERADRHFADWKAQTDLMLEHATQEREAYRDRIANQKFSLEAAIKDAELEAIKQGNTAAVEAFATGDAAAALDFLERQEKVQVDLAKIAASLEAARMKPPPTIEERLALAEQRFKEAPNDPAAKQDVERARSAFAFAEKLAAARGGGAAAARLAVERQAPLTPKQAENLVHPKTMQGPPPGLSMAEATAQGYVEVDEKDRTALADLQQTRALVGTIGGMAQRLITATTPAEALKQWGLLTAGARTGTNPTARAYDETLESFLGVLSRSLAAERGVLTDRDIARVRRAFPNFFDTQQVASAKLGLIEILLETATRGRMAKMTKQPLDQEALRADINRLLGSLESVAAARGPATSKGATEPMVLPDGTTVTIER